MTAGVRVFFHLKDRTNDITDDEGALDMSGPRERKCVLPSLILRADDQLTNRGGELARRPRLLRDCRAVSIVNDLQDNGEEVEG